ncbi:DUF1496 domain-containing protein [Phytobacter sp. V91]|uniref:DUF1496 domain-containing protein n=1 Tax=Phytobacter sp. V91 TaxID=3369425 RepID=UPI003F6400EA
MKRLQWVMVGLLMVASAGVQANRQISPDVQVNVPAEVFSSGGQQTAPSCNQCCIYEGRNYSEGAVVKMEGVLLQCGRDERTISTHPLAWRRIKP